MGRLWQQLILKKFHPIFEFISIESIIKQRQKEYYEALEKSDKEGTSTYFIQFSLETILSSLENFLKLFQPQPLSAEDRLTLFHSFIQSKEFSRKEYIRFFKTISTATASRDLAFGVKNKVLKRKGTKALTVYSYLFS